MKYLIVLLIVVHCDWIQPVTSVDNDTLIVQSDSQNITTRRTFEIENCECGLKHRLDSRIVGGERIDIKEYPWMVGISVYGNIICGGALISDQYIITAAHCFKMQSMRTWSKVRLGFTHRNDKIPDVKIAEIISHEYYLPNRSGLYDIALIKLAQPVTFSSSVYPICLPTPGEQYDNETATVAGWGVINRNGKASEVLRSASVKVIPLSTCVHTYQKAQKNVNENNICAGGMEGRDACQGDSGSPLFLEQNGVYKVIGIVSWGIGCASKYPGVYTDVNYYLPWIKQHFLQNCESSTV